MRSEHVMSLVFAKKMLTIIYIYIFLIIYDYYEENKMSLLKESIMNLTNILRLLV